MENQKMYTAEEAAKKLRISRTTLTRLIQAGKIGCHRFGHRTMFTEEILKDFIGANYQPPVRDEREAA